MPIVPNFDWDQTEKEVNLTISLNGVKKEGVDVFISDLFIKVNASATSHLLPLDLLHPIVVEKSKFSVKIPTVRISLAKQEEGLVWEGLCIKKDVPKAEVTKRRAEAQTRAEQLYNTTLDTREKQKEVEKKRMLEDHWELEHKTRQVVEKKQGAEKAEEQEKLYEWEGTVRDEQEKKKKAAPKTPADMFAQAQEGMPPVRQLETTSVPISFTTKSNTMPSRSRTDEDRYRKSKYKPVRVEDSPVFWKDKADRCFKVRDWHGAIEAYSEAVKRDGSFLAAVSNRAATYIHTGDYPKAINDCDLALNILANTPASDTTQESYRRSLIRLHTRRGAALCWNGEVDKGMGDYRLAAAYKDPEQDQDLVEDLEVIMAYMKKEGLIEFDDPAGNKRSDAGQLYFKGNYAAAVTMYQELLADNEFDVKSRSNLCATFLQQGAFQSALEEAKKLIDFCAEVATALNQPGAQGSAMEDSDDEDDCEDPMVAQKVEAARTIQEKSGHVYLLLKSYVRAGAALCGLKDLKGGYEMLERALRITPYDDDLRDDANRILEKLRMDTLISATSSGGGGSSQSAAPQAAEPLTATKAPPANLPAAVEGALKKPSDNGGTSETSNAPPKKKKKVTLGLSEED